MEYRPLCGADHMERHITYPNKGAIKKWSCKRVHTNPGEYQIRKLLPEGIYQMDAELFPVYVLLSPSENSKSLFHIY